jgi:hypothetical protein
MNKPTGKQIAALRKAERRVMRAVRAEDMAKTPQQQALAAVEGMRAAEAYGYKKARFE